MNIQACVFDAYGTLFDVHSAIGRHRERLGEIADQVSNVWRIKQLEYTWLRSLMRTHADFWQVTVDALDYAFDSFGLNDRQLRNDLLDAYMRLSCYPEVPETLGRLKRGGMRTAILSNGSPEMLEAAVTGNDLHHLVDRILSVEDVGIYKPDPRVYQLAVDRLELGKADIAFQSSNSWDIAGAAAFGFNTVWVNRFGQRRERLPSGPAVEINNLAELPPLVSL
jgi:2-haloacid dehalogenase